jgi:hypothetical protein
MLTLANSGSTPHQLVILVDFPEGFPVRGSVMISQRFAPSLSSCSVIAKISRPSLTHSRVVPIVSAATSAGLT